LKTAGRGRIWRHKGPLKRKSKQLPPRKRVKKRDQNRKTKSLSESKLKEI